MKKFRWDKKYLYWGITAFLVVVACILFYMLLTRITGISAALKSLMTILSPFVWGLVIAYLMCPLMNILENNVFTPAAAKLYKNKEAKLGSRKKLARGLSVLVTMLVLIFIISATITIIMPRIAVSLSTIVKNASSYAEKAYDWIDKMLVDYPQIESVISSYFGSLSDGLVNWISSTILPRLNSVITNVTSGVYYLVKGIYNILIGFIVAVYVLYNKDTFSAYVKKLIYCVFSLEAAEKVIKGVHFVDTVFLNFLSGKILDSVIIGFICYIGCLILKMPFAVLVAFIVGITNVIPFFGPFIGAIPSAIIILMSDPLKCLIFIIFIFLLQQFDGNILGPKILGNSVGINGFWIMFSIILGAGLFGFVGMLLGVPVFVVIYTGISGLVRRKLSRSGLPEETEFYAGMSYINAETGESVQRESKRSARQDGKNKKTGGRKAAAVDKNKADGKSAETKGTDDELNGGPQS